MFFALKGEKKFKVKPDPAKLKKGLAYKARLSAITTFLNKPMIKVVILYLNN